jgi:predicted TIM-barrel fold metal-dependent hydrolase
MPPVDQNASSARTGDGVPTTLIDMHCHVFNAADLPAGQFIYRVVEQRFSQDPDALIVGIALLLTALGGSAPTPVQELADIKAAKPTKNAVAAVAAAAPQGAGALLDWLKLFAHPRRDLIAKLAGFYTATNHRCELIAPAVVDYNAWLNNPDEQDKRLTDQVAVMGAIAKLPGKPRVHGFVPFDPVRAIMAPLGYYPGGTHMEMIYPLDLVKDAIENHGFLGVKLYPPMGFRAWNNGKGDIAFSSVVKTFVNQGFSGPIGDRQLGGLIDKELEKLYRYCADQGVPILAHAYNSNQAEECTGWRASPQYWSEVIDKFSSPEKPLRLCLGHFGSFAAHTKFPTCTDAFGAKAWEIIVGSIIATDKGSHVFADLSYLSEVLDRSASGQKTLNTMAKQFQSFVGTYDKAVEHISYGSDWIMLGLESGHERYHLAVGEFLRRDVGFDAAQLANVYFNNAINFLGLRPGDQNRARLEKFYRDNNIEQHFPAIDAMV